MKNQFSILGLTLGSVAFITMAFPAFPWSAFESFIAFWAMAQTVK